MTGATTGADDDGAPGTGAADDVGVAGGVGATGTITSITNCPAVPGRHRPLPGGSSWQTVKTLFAGASDGTVVATSKDAASGTAAGAPVASDAFQPKSGVVAARRPATLIVITSPRCTGCAAEVVNLGPTSIGNAAEQSPGVAEQAVRSCEPRWRASGTLTVSPLRFPAPSALAGKSPEGTLVSQLNVTADPDSNPVALMNTG
jgi:hypothetical protein